MPSIETSIWLALRGRVESLVLSPAHPVAWPNESFSPPPGGYLRVTHLPNVSTRPFLGSNEPHRRIGLLQIDVFARKQQDASVATEIAGKVAEHFSADLPLRRDGITVRITKAPDVAQHFPTDAAVMVPVTVRYEAIC